MRNGIKPELKVNKKEQVTQISKIVEINTDIEGVKIKEKTCELAIE